MQNARTHGHQRRRRACRHSSERFRELRRAHRVAVGWHRRDTLRCPVRWAAKTEPEFGLGHAETTGIEYSEIPQRLRALLPSDIGGTALEPGWGGNVKKCEAQKSSFRRDRPNIFVFFVGGRNVKKCEEPKQQIYRASYHRTKCCKRRGDPCTHAGSGNCCELAKIGEGHPGSGMSTHTSAGTYLRRSKGGTGPERPRRTLLVARKQPSTKGCLSK